MEKNEFGHPTAITANGYVHGFMTTTGSNLKLRQPKMAKWSNSWKLTVTVPPAHQAKATKKTLSLLDFKQLLYQHSLLQVTNPVIEMMVLYTDQARTDAGVRLLSTICDHRECR
jgi:hypothetical protein